MLGNNNTVKFVWRDNCSYERPPVLKDHIFLAEGPTIPCIWSFHQRPPVLRDHSFMANEAVFQDMFCCISTLIDIPHNLTLLNAYRNQLCAIQAIVFNWKNMGHDIFEALCFLKQHSWTVHNNDMCMALHELHRRSKIFLLHNFSCLEQYWPAALPKWSTSLSMNKSSNRGDTPQECLTPSESSTFDLCQLREERLWLTSSSTLT